MSLSALLPAAAREAQGLLAQLQGMDASAEGSFVGPDGRTYTLLFRAADAFETQAAGREMSQHGYLDRSVVIATATRDQFTSPPVDWRRKTGTRLVPAPAQECTIASMSTDDPLHYVFVLLFRQSA